MSWFKRSTFLCVLFGVCLFSASLAWADSVDDFYGERYFPVILVETADFKALDSAFIARMFSEEGIFHLESLCISPASPTGYAGLI